MAAPRRYGRHAGFSHSPDPSGFAIFALGLAGSALSISHLGPASLVPDPPTGTVRAVRRPRPSGTVGMSVEAALRQDAAWIDRLQDDARVRVTMDDYRIEVRNGDYMAALGESAPEAAPDGARQPRLRHHRAAARERRRARTTSRRRSASVAGEEAPWPQVEPVWPKQRVVLIDHDEKVARDHVRRAVEDASTASLALRRITTAASSTSPTTSCGTTPTGFFAAEVLLAKGEAHHRLGEIDAAIAAYRALSGSFPRQPDGRADAAADRAPARPRFGGADERALDAWPARPASSPLRPAAAVPASDIAVRASSVLRPSGRVDYDAVNLLDGDPGTAWSEGRPVPASA